MIPEVDGFDRIGFDNHGLLCFIRRLTAVTGVAASPVSVWKSRPTIRIRTLGFAILIDEVISEEWDLVTGVLRQRHRPYWNTGRSHYLIGSGSDSDGSPRITPDCMKRPPFRGTS